MRVLKTKALLHVDEPGLLKQFGNMLYGLPRE